MRLERIGKNGLRFDALFVRNFLGFHGSSFAKAAVSKQSFGRIVKQAKLDPFIPCENC